MSVANWKGWRQGWQSVEHLAKNTAEPSMWHRCDRLRRLWNSSARVPQGCAKRGSSYKDGGLSQGARAVVFRVPVTHGDPSKPARGHSVLWRVPMSGLTAASGCSTEGGSGLRNSTMFSSLHMLIDVLLWSEAGYFSQRGIAKGSQHIITLSTSRNLQSACFSA